MEEYRLAAQAALFVTFACPSFDKLWSNQKTAETYSPDAQYVLKEYGIHLLKEINGTYEAIILAVSHEPFRQINIEKLKSSEASVFFDTKAFLNKTLIDGLL